MSPVELKGITVDFGDKRVLDGINLTVRSGEVLAVLGENGSGKSTLLRAATGLITPTSGQVRLFGVPLGRQVPWHRIGYVPQRILAPSGIPATAAEVVRTGLLSRRWLRAPRDLDRVIAALDEVGLAHLAHEVVADFSGGQAQRVAIARALVRDPDLIILDEPTAGVDEKRKQTLADLLGTLASQGRAVIIVLHDLGPFAQVINRTITLGGGKITHTCKVIDGVPVHISPDEDDFHDIDPHDEAFDTEVESAFARANNPLGW